MEIGFIDLPECRGTFDGCRARTVFGIRTFLAELGKEKPGPAALPDYRRYTDEAGRPQFEIVCRRKHNGQNRYYSDGDRLQVLRDGKIEDFSMK